MNKSEYIFGLRAVIEAVEAGKNIEKILIRRDLGGELAKELWSVASRYGIVVQKVPLEKHNRITMKNHQGAIALLSPVAYFRLEQIVPSLYEEGVVPLVLILDSVTDTRNFGAIARTAECAAVDAIVVPERNSAGINADAVKTSAGALMRIPVCKERTVAEAVSYLKDCGYTIIGASEKTEQLYTAADYTAPTAIVLGAEDKGISPEVLKMCDSLVRIPILGAIESLNVSVAGGIIIYEAVRQRLSAGFSPE